MLAYYPEFYFSIYIWALLGTDVWSVERPPPRPLVYSCAGNGGFLADDKTRRTVRPATPTPRPSQSVAVVWQGDRQGPARLPLDQ
jgi:hypothetical protein